MKLPDFPEIHVYPFEPFLKLLIFHIQNSSIKTVEHIAEQYQAEIEKIPLCKFTNEWGYKCECVAVTVVNGLECCFSHARTRAAYYKNGEDVGTKSTRVS
jgi:hypothetical protein